MTNVYETLEFNVIIDQIKNYCFTEQAREGFSKLLPHLDSFISNRSGHICLPVKKEAW